MLRFRWPKWVFDPAFDAQMERVAREEVNERLRIWSCPGCRS